MDKTNQVENPAYIVMQSYTAEIVSSGLDPMEIARKLFSSKTSRPILGENDYDTITSRLTGQSGSERLQSLVRIVCIAIKRDQDNEVFPTFLQVLLSVGSITSCKLAENLHTALQNEEMKNHQATQSSSSFQSEGDDVDSNGAELTRRQILPNDEPSLPHNKAIGDNPVSHEQILEEENEIAIILDDMIKKSKLKQDQITSVYKSEEMFPVEEQLQTQHEEEN